MAAAQVVKLNEPVEMGRVILFDLCERFADLFFAREIDEFRREGIGEVFAVLFFEETKVVSYELGVLFVVHGDRIIICRTYR
jgi:hypothetical protein